MQQTPDLWKTVPGWFDFQPLYFGTHLWLPQGAVVVEVGVWRGRSIIALAQHLRAHGRHDVELIGVDTFAGSPNESAQTDAVAQRGGSMYDEFVANCSRCGVPCGEVVFCVRSDSVEAAMSFPVRADFVFLDGAHDYYHVTKDIAAWRKVLQPGGVLAGHDVDQFSVRSAVCCAFGDSWTQVPPRTWMVRL